jgi:[protein-PII] uridylyltransferase
VTSAPPGAPSSAPLSLRVARQQRLDDRSLRGRAWCQAYAAAADQWLSGVFATACAGDPRRLALLAVGGYGRGELAPGSDLDLLLVHDRKNKIRPVADAVWYPIWDEGIHLDHSVRTVKEVRAAADSDLKVALGLLDARLVAGDAALADEVIRRVGDLWNTRAERWLPDVDAQIRARHREQGDVAFLLEPDLKEGRGGLRDVTALKAVARVTPILAATVADPELGSAADLLIAARVELQRSTGKATSRLLLQEQDRVAAALGLVDADELMALVSGAARVVAWASDDGWRRVLSSIAGPRGRSGSADRPLEPGLVLRDDEVTLSSDADPAEDPSLAFRAAAVSAELDRPLARATLDRLGEAAPDLGGAWSDDVLQAWLRLLGAGAPAVAAIESLDRLGVWMKYLPEWAAVRNRPQRNAYHRFTVDRHLVETAVNASALVRRVNRPDLLLAGALLHDIGKGRGGDHTEIGIDVVRKMAPRLGFSADDTEILATMVRHHLLLPDVATRRDLDDPKTISLVADAVGDVVTLQLLAGLTEADSLATGSSAWGPWKAELVAELTRRVEAALAGHEPVWAPAELTAAERALLDRGGLQLVAHGGEVTVVAPDQPGLLATVAGVLALRAVLVRSAATRSAPNAGMAVLSFEVVPAFDRLPDWDAVRVDLAAALEGRLALEERLEERERHYARMRRATTANAPEVVVTAHAEVSAVATVIEVRAPDTGPVLYRIARAIADAGLFISWARVATLGAEVLDVFYVQTTDATKIPGGPDALRVLEQTIAAAVGTGRAEPG